MSRASAACALATVGPLGRLPAAGTWGSVIGLLLGFAGLGVSRTPLLLVMLAATFPICALVCTLAERHLAQHDPPSVILDEVWAMAAVIIVQIGVIGDSGRLAWIAFLLFRLFDILKPPPLKRLARLPAGWGIITDDLGAAVYACAILWAIHHMTNFGF